MKMKSKKLIKKVSEMEDFLSWITRGGFDFYTRFCGKRAKQQEAKKRFKELEDKNEEWFRDYLEVYKMTDTFEEEYVVLQHRFLHAGRGTNYDWTYIEFRGHRFIRKYLNLPIIPEYVAKDGMLVS